MTETPRDDKPKPARRPRIKLPFDNRREDVGSWTYDHRIGLCVTLIAYLALMIVFVSSKIVVGRRTHQQGMYIDLQTLAEMEQERDRLEREVRERQRQEEIDWWSIRNQASNENALNEKLRDDRGTNAAALNEAAAERGGAPTARPTSRGLPRSGPSANAAGRRTARNVRTARSRGASRCRSRLPIPCARRVIWRSRPICARAGAT